MTDCGGLTPSQKDSFSRKIIDTLVMIDASDSYKYNAAQIRLVTINLDQLKES